MLNLGDFLSVNVSHATFLSVIFIRLYDEETSFFSMSVTEDVFVHKTFGLVYSMYNVILLLFWSKNTFERFDIVEDISCLYKFFGEEIVFLIYFLSPETIPFL